MDTPDISIFSLFLACLLLLIPIALSAGFKVGLIKSIIVSVMRMGIQLALVGVFLQYVFAWENNLVNIVWFLTMVTFATSSVIRESDLKLRHFMLPTLLSFTLANGLIILYFNYLVVNLPNILDAKYLIAIGGMLLGNSLKGNVVGISNFYQNIKRDENRYLYNLSLGASQLEVLLPYFRSSMRGALKPTIASMATMGIVFLPGMMTGQILAGMNPMEAIKYQIAVMIAIFAATALSVALTIFFTARAGFSSTGVIRKELFRDN